MPHTTPCVVEQMTPSVPKRFLRHGQSEHYHVSLLGKVDLCIIVPTPVTQTRLHTVGHAFADVSLKHKCLKGKAVISTELF